MQAERSRSHSAFFEIEYNHATLDANPFFSPSYFGPLRGLTLRGDIAEKLFVPRCPEIVAGQERMPQKVANETGSKLQLI